MLDEFSALGVDRKKSVEMDGKLHFRDQ